jgi:hypothetical protein
MGLLGATSTTANESWPCMFKLARNLYCHEGTTRAVDVQEMYEKFCVLFGGRTKLRHALKSVYDSIKQE